MPDPHPTHPQIHPTASVSPDAQLADDVVIGPRCTLTGDVRLGSGTHLIGDVYLRGPITLGQRNLIYPHACLGFPPQSRTVALKHVGLGVRIGDGNTFREGCTVHSALFKEHPTTIGHDNYLMAYVHIAHDAIIHNETTLANNVMVAGHCVVHDRATLGGGAGIHQFVRVGELAMVAGNTGFTQDIPPFCMVEHPSSLVMSINRRGLIRADLKPHARPLRRAFDILYHERHTNPSAVEAILDELGDDPLCRRLARFVQESERGIVGALPREA